MTTPSWVRDIQDRVKRASNDVNIALQPRVAQAKRSLEASIQQIGLTPGPEIFEGDESLHAALGDLDILREALSTIAATVDQHRSRLLDLARTQSSLASHLDAPEKPLLPLLHRHLSAERVDAQVSLASAQAFTANSLSRFALDMSTPMADLSRTFEEAFVSKITPLKKRYISQKTEFLRYSRQAAATDDPLRRENLNSIAQSALPTFTATSETLMAEIQSLLRYTVSNLSEWSLNVTQAQAETYARAARVFEEPAKQAEAAQNPDSDPVS